jgi:hypothetical protein
MPIHLNDVDVIPDVVGLRSALIVPCNMCPAVTVAVREDKPFIQFFKGLLKSDPFERHITALQSRLGEKGVSTKVFRSDLPHQWFVCMWPSGRRNKLRKQAQQHDAAIVLGCDTATETVRDSLESTGCKVIEGMEVIGFMNAKLKVRWPCDVVFEDSKVIPMSQRRHEEGCQPEA